MSPDGVVFEAAPGPQGTDVRFGPDGDHIFASFGRLLSWNLLTGAVREFESTGHGSFGRRFGLSNDGRFLFRGHTIWNALTGQKTRVLDIPGGTDWGTLGAAFSPDDKLIAFAQGSPGFLRICSLRDGKIRHSLKVVGIDICVAFSPDGRQLATGSGYGQNESGEHQCVQVWDSLTGKELFKADKHRYAIWSLAYSPDGKWLAGASGAYQIHGLGEVVIWDALTGIQQATLRGYTDCVYSVCFSPNGQRLATASAKGTDNFRVPGHVKIWDLTTGLELYSYQIHKGGVNAVAYSPDGSRLASVGVEGSLKIIGRPFESK